MISLKINHQQVKARPTQTILKVAKANGIYIPTLCHLPRFNTRSVCRICVVEVEGVRGLLPACSAIVSAGMEIHTHSDVVMRSRRVLLEFILAEHHGLRKDDEKLKSLCHELGVEGARFELPVKKPAHCETVKSEYMRIDLPRCILCDRCIRVCEGREVITRSGFGKDISIAFDDNKSVDESSCIRCGDCIESCPTGAISRNEAGWN